ncbi:uncharacterized protein LOC133814639 [Humulus lupulus]|uniref:uncharacterized protein LOC133814639 n=1 Tax=Humulus lupulus TaxID=3486 RepID=UPI002B40355C|nr:uncharacterized protein LOC133814639 [Humulus lupulus]
MDSENVFDIYSAPEAPEAPSSKKKTSKRHPGERSKAPLAQETRTADPPVDGPSTNVTPPPSPLEQQTPPTPVGSTPSPPALTDQTQQAMLNLTAARLRSGTITEQSRASEQRHAEELKIAEAKYAEQLEAVLEEKNKLAKELREKQATLDKAIEQRDKFKESNRINYRKAKSSRRT